MLTSPARQATAARPARASLFQPRGLSASSIRPAPSEDVAPATVRNIVRRPKKRPRTEAGTRSPIHAIQALLPITARTAVTAMSAMNSWRRVASLTGRYGKATRGRYTSREAPTAATASRFRPTTCVSHAAGMLSTLQATGSAPSSPITTGLAPRWSAHAVSTPPPAQAAKTSAAAPSKSEARSDGRSCAQGLSAGPSLPGSGPDDNAGAEPGSDSPGCGTAAPRPTRATRSRSGELAAMIQARLCRDRARFAAKARVQRETTGQRHARTLTRQPDRPEY